jgi:hypothetical protein
MAMNMVAVHSTSVSLMNVLLDLNSSPTAVDYISRLRQEIHEARKSSGDKLTRVALTKLTHLDSTIKESMRLTDLLAINVNRKV